MKTQFAQFGKQVEALLNERMMGVPELAKRSGLTKAYIYNIISNKPTPNPSFKTVWAIAEAFGVPMIHFKPEEYDYKALFEKACWIMKHRLNHYPADEESSWEDFIGSHGDEPVEVEKSCETCGGSGKVPIKLNWHPWPEQASCPDCSKPADPAP